MSMTGVRTRAFIKTLADMTAAADRNGDCTSMSDVIVRITDNGIGQFHAPVPGSVQTATSHGIGDGRHAEPHPIDPTGSLHADDAWEGRGEFAAAVNGEEIGGRTVARALRL